MNTSIPKYINVTGNKCVETDPSELLYFNKEKWGDVGTKTSYLQYCLSEQVPTIQEQITCIVIH